MPGSTKSDTKLENEIRISYKSDALDYVYKAIVLFETYDEIILSGVGKAISSVVNVAEMVKRRAKGLHQFTKLYEKEHIEEEDVVVIDLDHIEETIMKHPCGIIEDMKKEINEQYFSRK
ncbi:hypothetical protein PFMALIP_04580 [Plasmodium falciparum MaliPS096_E11]|uniref:DNA/RNA-binding protein Alba-like domain-containing protein n=1 Tax=Plasmodium falciparum MaliPS096_E11 TaxID=1036727 RepID=A0A024WLM3_PLAFA|nr:hypothetical protein PFMALIP_04580 [Plasmodium falciparum MaliPS096_E11]